MVGQQPLHPCDVVCSDMNFCIWCSNTAIHYRWEVLKYILLGKFLSTQREPVINISWELNICLPADQHFQYLLQFLCCFIYQVWLLEERRFYLQVRLWNEGLFAARQIWNCWSTLCHSKAISVPLSLSVQCGQITDLLRNYTASKSKNPNKCNT